MGSEAINVNTELNYETSNWCHRELLGGEKPHMYGVRSVVSVVVGKWKGDRNEEEERLILLSLYNYCVKKFFK